MPISSKKSLNKLHEEISICKQCLDLVKTRKNTVPGRGAPNSKLIIVGFYPEEVAGSKEGLPDTESRQDILMKKMLAGAGLSLDTDTYITYLVKCTPQNANIAEEGAGQKKYVPSEKHISNCINYFTEEISIITPHIIVSLGIDASNIILRDFFSSARKHTDMSKLHMKLFENPSFKLIPFYSLQEVLDGSVSELRYLEDFRNLSKLFRIV